MKETVTATELHATLKGRLRPEDVADMILKLEGTKFGVSERRMLQKVARGSVRQNVYGYTSMASTFATAVGAGKQIAKAKEIFKIGDSEEHNYNDGARIEAFLEAVSPLIYKPVGGNNFKTDRINKEQRMGLGLDISKRSYNKKWRLLKRIENKLLKFARESKKIEFQMIGKHGFAHELDLETFGADLNSACFIAYYNARCNLRSEFTISGQQRHFDEVCEMLFKKCKDGGEAGGGLFSFFKGEQVQGPVAPNWWAIAQIYPHQEVLRHLSDERKGRLLGRWTTVLQEIAALLEELWNQGNLDKETMVVKRGNDSTTWNNTAGAWNKARDNWMNLIFALGMEELLDHLCFGKVMRLMAGDVAAWHRMSGGGLDPNTMVWSKLPLPWEVFGGKAVLSRQTVEECCKAAGVDALKSGWIAPRVHGVAKFRPTPELVHGVTVSNPYLATVLKQHGYFSGKSATPIFPAEN
jgi:hypothetical protein